VRSLDTTPFTYPRARPLLADLPGPRAGCVISAPDAEFKVTLGPLQWASVLASAVALHTASEQVVVDIRVGTARTVRVHRISLYHLPVGQDAQDAPADSEAQLLVCDQPAKGINHCVVVHVSSDCAAIALDHGLFTAETRARFADHVERLATTNAPLGSCRLPVVTVTRPRRVVAESTERRAETDWGDCVIGRLLEVALHTPDATALVAGEDTLSYGALCSWVGGVAERIRATDLRPGRVGVLARHGLHAVIGALAALATGSAYVPLDVNLPDGRLRRILRQASPDVVLYGPDLGERVQRVASDTTTVAVEPCSASLRQPSSGSAGVRGDRAAYVLFTSGTTGTPKGVCQTVSGLMRHARAYRDSIALAGGETVPLLASLAFDAAVMDLYGGLFGGATVHVVDPLQTSANLREAIRARPPAVLHATPTLLRHLLADAGAPWPEMTGVRVIVFGGERVCADDVALVRRVLPGADVINGFGPSECTLAIQHVIAADDPVDAVIPIGTAVRGVEVHLRSPGGGDAELAGELVLTSAAVAAGYLGQDELTDRRFQTHQDGSRSYCTGDLVWRRADGALVFLGRVDRQLKVRGQRVEPDEIEAVLQSHPTVAQAAVILGRAGGLVAYVTAATAFQPVPADVLRFAGKQLPGAAVPGQVIVIERMPIGPTGKRDLSALPDPSTDSVRLVDAFTPDQHRVADVWVRLLRHDRFGADDDFLLVGGDSLLMLDLWTALQEEFAVTLDFAEVTARSTVAELSALCTISQTREATI
jgi:amino acid adenylation domain-containing protein